MRHLRAGRKLNRTSSHRTALMRNLVTALFEHERVRTTEAKAKELKPLADKIVTLAKKGDLHARRLALRWVKSKSVVKKIFESLAPRFANRNGGYTRIYKLDGRVGDGAILAIIELVDRPAVTSEKEKAKASAKKGTKKKKQSKTAEEQKPAGRRSRKKATEPEEGEAKAED